MVEETPNHGFKNPPAGHHARSDLGAALNQNWRDVDSVLSSLYDHIVETSEELAAAFDDAESNRGISIRIGGGVYTPFQYKDDTQAWDLSGGTTIHGSSPGQDDAGVMAMDRIVATIGTRIDCEGNTLFDVIDSTGLQIEGLGIHNCVHAFECGEPLDFDGQGGFEFGSSQSTIRNVAAWDHSDVAFKIRNFQRLRLDRIIQFDGPGLIHAVSSTDNFQPGNSVWTDCHSSPSDNTNPGFHLEARNQSLNYIHLQRPQVIVGTGDNTNAALKLEGSVGSRPNGITVEAGDFEGAWGNYVEMTYASRCHIEFDHNNLASDPQCSLDSNSQLNWIHSHNSATCDSQQPTNGLTGHFEASGSWFGYGYEAGINAPVIMVGTDVDTYRIELGSTTSLNNVNLEGVVRTRHNSRDLTTISGTAVGEVMLHNGGGANPQGRYEWNGSGWVGIGAASGTTITP